MDNHFLRVKGWTFYTGFPGEVWVRSDPAYGADPGHEIRPGTLESDLLDELLAAKTRIAQLESSTTGPHTPYVEDAEIVVLGVDGKPVPAEKAPGGP
ncbi:MAG TPA: hypothetical protein VM537_28990 [Anaerolineae bacterium]|nr:hypothetical protein [Anaerolineae bacterium]